MNRARAVIGWLLLVIGALWTLQGVGLVGGSAMSGEAIWAIIGPVVALAGLLLLASRRRRREPLDDA